MEWVLSSVAYVFRRGKTERLNTDRRGEGDVEREADTGVTQHKPRIANSHQQLGVVFPEPQEGRLPA